MGLGGVGIFAGAISMIVHALMPGIGAILYQAPIAYAIAYFVARQQAPYDEEPYAFKTTALISGGGGALIFAVLGLLPGLLTALLALSGMWIATSLALDRHLETDFESGQRIAGLICLPIWVVWAGIGAALHLALGVGGH
jgi:hypothetical protein